VSRAAGRLARQLPLALASAGALLPVYVMLTAALKTQRDFLGAPFALPLHPTLHAFNAALDDQFVRWLLNSLLVTGGSVGITVALAACAAWGFARWSFRGRDTLLAVLVSLMVVPPVVLMIPLFQLGVDLGAIGTFHYVIAIYVGLMLPFSIYLLTGFFRTIPRELIDAAMVDGAGSFVVFRRIVLPLSKAPLLTLVVVNVLWAWNELLIALVFLNDDRHRTLMVGLTGFQSRYSLDVPTVMAGLSLASLPIVALYLFGQRYFVRGLVAGALKE
jgi:ABC-type glycerol-3-phosphate transport system permease component